MDPAETACGTVNHSKSIEESESSETGGEKATHTIMPTDQYRRRTNLMKFFFCTASLLVLITTGSIALAHGPGGGTSGSESKTPAYKFNIAAPHHEPAAFQKPPNMELSVDGETIRLILTEADGTPIDTEFADAKTYVIIGGRLSPVHLWPAGDNILSGKGDFISEPGMRVDVKLHLPGRETIRKDFYPLK